MNTLSLLIGIVVGLLSIVTFLGGVFAYVKASSRKEYAAQRDMEHFKNNLRQLKEAIGIFEKMLTENYHEIQMSLIQLNSKVDVISSRDSKKD